MTAPQVPGDGKEGRGRLCYSCDIEPATGIGRCRTCDHPASSSSAPVTGFCTCMGSAVGPHTHEPEAAPVTGDAQPDPEPLTGPAPRSHEAQSYTHSGLVGYDCWCATPQPGDAQRALLDAADVLDARSDWILENTHGLARGDVAVAWGQAARLVREMGAVRIHGCCGATVGQRHNLSCPTMSAADALAEIAATGSPDTGEGDT